MNRRRRPLPRPALWAALCLTWATVWAEAPAPDGEAVFRGYRPVGIVREHLDGTLFDVPRGVHYDSQGEIFIADSGNGLIGIFDERGVPKFTFAPGRRADYPTAVTTDPEGNIYVLNAGANVVAVFDYRGTPLREITFGEIDRVEVIPSDLVMGPGGLLYVLDAGGGRILACNLQGEIVRIVGRKGRRGGPRLLAPVDMAFDARGYIYVVDRRGTPVQVYDPAGAYVRGWGEREIGAENFSTPSGIAVDAAGHVIVVDAVRQDVKVFDEQGAFLGNLGGFGQEPGRVAYPEDVAATPDGRIIVVERVGRRFQIFEKILSPGAPDGAARSKIPTYDETAAK